MLTLSNMTISYKTIIGIVIVVNLLQAAWRRNAVKCKLDIIHWLLVDINESRFIFISIVCSKISAMGNIPLYLLIKVFIGIYPSITCSIIEELVATLNKYASIWEMSTFCESLITF